MYTSKFQDILPLVNMPTQYAGNEINAVRKDPDTVDLTFALVFPDLYEIGTSHFGLQILYSILNGRKNIAAERFFAPAPDMEQLLLERQIPSLSMESKTDLKLFDVIGISLLYELNYTNILTLLGLSGIPFYARDRQALFPLLIGGGPCAFNPEPLADFFDAFVIGDGEKTSLEISEKVIEFKKQGDGKKDTLLRTLSRIDGVYVPEFFEPFYDENGMQCLKPKFEDYKTVKRAFLSRLDADFFPVSPIIPFAKPVHDRLRLEIARGCSRGCRFCQAGMIYRPVRERSIEDLVSIAETSMKETGYSDLSLLSLSTGDYSDLPGLIVELYRLGRNRCNAVSLPSIRAEKLTPRLMDIIRQVRKTGFTIAPEAGSQRLRDIINKNLTQEDIENTVANAFELGWKTIKLYFMIGLPFEDDDDIKAICDLAGHLAAAHAKGKKMINVSAACFIPKSHTPFQRCPQIPLEEIKRKLQYLKDHLRHKKINLKWQTPEMSLLEGVWARGDRRLSKLLVQAFDNGCRLDGWTDRFDFKLWEKAFEQTGLDPEFYTSRKRDDNEPLPWDVIDSGVSEKFLKKEYEKAENQALTADCRDNDCTGCGVCDFKTIEPVLCAQAGLSGNADAAEIIALKQIPDDAFIKFEFEFSKLDSARFFGHLELASIIERAVKRAGLQAKYSKGFNPLMRLSFETALPLGMESEREYFYLFLEKDIEPERAAACLNQNLPEGLEIIACRPYSKFLKHESSKDYYRVTFPEPCLTGQDIEAFAALSEFVVEDKSKKGRTRQTDLRKYVEKIEHIDSKTIEIVIKKYDNRVIRPAVILTRALKIDEKIVTCAKIRKLKTGTRKDFSGKRI